MDLYAEQIAIEAKKLKERNEDSVDLGCPSEVCSDESGLAFACEKLRGKLHTLGSEARGEARDRRAALDAAESEEQTNAIKRVYSKLPEKPEQTRGCVRSLAPKEEKRGKRRGHGAMHTSLYSQQKQKRKGKEYIHLNSAYQGVGYKLAA